MTGGVESRQYGKFIWLEMLPAEPVTRIMQYVMSLDDMYTLTNLLPIANFFPAIRDGLVSAMKNELTIPWRKSDALWWLSLFGCDLYSVTSHLHDKPWCKFDFQLLPSLSRAYITYSEQQLKLIRGTNVVDLRILFNGRPFTDSLTNTLSNLSLSSLELSSTGACVFCMIFREVSCPLDFALCLPQLQTLRISSKTCDGCVEGVWNIIDSLPMLSTLQLIDVRIPDNRVELLKSVPNICLKKIHNFAQIAEEATNNIEEVSLHLRGNADSGDSGLRALLQCPKLQTAEFVVSPTFPEARTIADVAALMSLKKLKLVFYVYCGEAIKDKLVEVLSGKRFELLSICQLNLTRCDISKILRMQANCLKDLYLEYDIRLDVVVEILESVLKWNHQLRNLGCRSASTPFFAQPFLTTLKYREKLSPGVARSIAAKASMTPSPEVEKGTLLLQRVTRVIPTLLGSL